MFRKLPARPFQEGMQKWRSLSFLCFKWATSYALFPWISTAMPSPWMLVYSTCAAPKPTITSIKLKLFVANLAARSLFECKWRSTLHEETKTLGLSKKNTESAPFQSFMENLHTENTLFLSVSGSTLIEEKLPLGTSLFKPGHRPKRVASGCPKIDIGLKCEVSAVWH